MPPIFLRPNESTQTSDDSGILIQKRIFPVYYQGPYTQDLLPHDKKILVTLDYVNPLEYYCIKSLFSKVDQLDLGGVPRILFGANVQEQLRMMKTLIPSFDQRMRQSQMKYIDPRLWATLIQLFAHLPPAFRTYSLPLSDIYLPLLQNVTSTVDFTLITILNLSHGTDLTDSTIAQLKPLTNLCVLDISSTRVGTWGVKQLSICLTLDKASGVRFGLWNLRVWSMRNCKSIRNDVKPILQTFPLLTIIDLRGTSVTEASSLTFESCPSPQLQSCYYPYLTISWIDALWALHPKELFKCWTEKPYMLHIDTLEHPPPPLRDHPRAKLVPEDDRVCVLLPNGEKKCKTTDELTRVETSVKKPVTKLDSPGFYQEDEDECSEGTGEWSEETGEWSEETGEWSEETGEWSEGTGETAYQNQLWESLAGLAAETLAAKNFYTSTNVFGEVGGNSESESEDENHYQSHPATTDKKQLKLMLFRHPPSFHTLDATYPMSSFPSISKQGVMDGALRKKTKRTDFTKAFLNMASLIEGYEPKVTTDSDSESMQSPVSANPFLAKKQVTLARVPKADSNGSSHTPMQTKQSRKPKGFDMKAWTTKVKK